MAACSGALTLLAADPDSGPTEERTIKSLYLERVDSGKRLLTAGRAAEAEEMFRSALRSEPSNPTNALVLANLSEAQRQLGKFDEAVESCDIGLVRFPASSVLRMNRAKALLESGRESESADELDCLLKTDSLNMSALRLRLVLAMQGFGGDSARIFADRMISVDSTADDAHFFLAELAIRAAGMPEENPEFADIHEFYSNELRNEAYDNFRKAIRLNPLEEYFVGYVQALQNAPDDRHAEIADALAEALRLYPEDWRFYLLRAVEHKRRYENEAAEMDARSALSKGADPAVVRQLLPKADRRSGRRK